MLQLCQWKECKGLFGIKTCCFFPSMFLYAADWPVGYIQSLSCASSFREGGLSELHYALLGTVSGTAALRTEGPPLLRRLCWERGEDK